MHVRFDNTSRGRRYWSESSERFLKFPSLGHNLSARDLISFPIGDASCRLHTFSRGSRGHDMISTADVVVVGSGGLGAATAHYLAKRRGVRVALLDKHEIGSQTSPRAAGMVSCVRKSDLMIKL